jgi:thiol-disulfide isomerase/thioredoxin
MKPPSGFSRRPRLPRSAGLLLAALLLLSAVPAIARPDSTPGAPSAPRDPARLFKIVDLDGQAVDVASLTYGKVALLAMWASWCQPCIEEIPKLRDLAKLYRDRGLVVVGIGLEQGQDTPAKQRHVAARQLVNYLLLFDSGRVFQSAYGLRSLPFTILVDADGRIAWQGALLPQDLDARIQALLADARRSGGTGI